MSQPEESQLTRPWVDWAARQIHDPVWRLRYLQSVVPVSPQVSRWKTRKTIGLLTLLALGLVVAPLSLRRLGAANAGPAGLPTLPAMAGLPGVSTLSAPPSIHRVEPAVAPSADVWSVEKASDFEVY